MKRTFLLSILAGISAALLPLAAISQVSQTSGSHATDQADRTYKYEAYAGYAYTSLNQVNESRYGLQGVNVSITRDWGRYFGVTAEGDYFRYPFSTPVVTGSSAIPSVESVFFGPVLHANISFAGGIGGGLEYKMSPRISLRASGDDIAASFSLTGNSAQLANSPHKTWDSRASIGIVYRF